jgi:hypothetical protein
MPPYRLPQFENRLPKSKFASQTTGRVALVSIKSSARQRPATPQPPSIARRSIASHDGILSSVSRISGMDKMKERRPPRYAEGNETIGGNLTA